MLLEDALKNVIETCGVCHYSEFTSAYERKIVYHLGSGHNVYYDEPKFVIALDDKGNSLHMLLKSEGDITLENHYNVLTILPTPPPTSRIKALSLSFSGELLALYTSFAVYVIDVTVPKDISFESEPQLIRPLYCTFDLNDFVSSQLLGNIVKVSWHPRYHQMLVILTENSSIYYISCAKSTATRGLKFNISFEADLSRFAVCMLDAVYYNVSTDENSDSENNPYPSEKKLDLTCALANKCVGFDFGSPSPVPYYFPKENKFNDCCLYVLYETGDVIQIVGCLSVQKASQLRVSMLQVLPPSIDNYGDDFCSIICLNLDSYDEVVTFDRQPDVLVIANKSGRLHNGIVLNTSATEYSKHDNPSTNLPILLCLVDIVDLQLTNNLCRVNDPIEVINKSKHLQTDSVSTCSVTNRLHLSDKLIPLCLQPAYFNIFNRYDFPNQVRSGNLCDLKQIQSYYAIHHTGVHLIDLPWMNNLSSWCASFSTDNLTSTEPKEIKEDIRNWQSCVKHLLCGEIPILNTESDRLDDINMENVGRFRLAGLIEFPNRFRSKDLIPRTLDDCHDSTIAYLNKGRLLSGSTLVIVQSPIEIDKAINKSLVQTIHLTAKPNFNNSPIKTTDPRDETASKQNAAHSQFSKHITRLFKSDDTHLPIITALNTQTNLTEHQSVQIFIQASETLRNGPLNRLITARSFIEQHSKNFGDLLAVQYSETMKLSAKRKNLQTRAERLCSQAKLISERQLALDKRAAELTTRLASFGNGPTKAEIVMHNELIKIRDRLQKGLRKWCVNLKTRVNELDYQLELHNKKCAEQNSSMILSPNLHTSLRRSTKQNKCDKLYWSTVSEKLRHESTEIRNLMHTVKFINTKTIDMTQPGRLDGES